MIDKVLWEGVFKDDDTTKRYFEICSSDSVSDAVEKHHILPKSIFPQHTKDKWNIVKLTYGDHYKVHKMLVSMCISKENKRKMVYAWNMISKRNSISEDEYACFRHIFMEYQKEFRHSKESKQKMSYVRLGKIRSLQSRVKQSQSLSGRKLSEDHKNNLSCSKIKYRDIIINGIKYPTIKHAVLKLGVVKDTVLNWIKSGKVTYNQGETNE